MMNPNVSQEKEDEMLHPKLQVALTSLNIDLEEELNYFQQSQKQRSSDTAVQRASSTSGSPNANSEEFSIAPTDDHAQWDLPQDYLESSEELLRELNNNQSHPNNVRSTVEKPSEKTKSSWRNYLLTPLGVAGILIFILAGTLLSLIFINLGEITSRQASTPTEPTGDDSPPPEEEETTSQTPEESSSPEIPNRPNLADDEFIELDTDNLVEAEPEEPEPSTPSCGSNFYCVMVENPTETEYNQTLQVTGDGYLRNFPEVGEVLQIGAFDTEARAEELVQTLEQQGISATIYKP